MKKLFLLTIFILSLTLTLAACGGDAGNNTEDEQNDAHVHAFGEWVSTKNATCTDSGVKTRSCSCGESETETVALLGHNFENGACTRCSVRIYGDVVKVWDVSEDENGNVTATLYEDLENVGFYALVISGGEAMKNYSTESDVPWYSSYKTKIKSVVIEDGVKSISDWAFYFCENLASATIGNSVIRIGSSAFYFCRGLENVVIPDSVKSIGDYAFNSCTILKSAVIGNGVTDIGNYAFTSCNGLASVVIGDSVSAIGEYAFAACMNLESIKYRGTQQQWSAIVKGDSWEPAANYTLTCAYKGD